MEPAYVSAVFGLVGATLGGVTSMVTGWLTQRQQLMHASRAGLHKEREALFRQFVQEASRLYGDALSHEKDDVADLVLLYALVGQMRLVASRETISCAEESMNRIADTYLERNRNLRELRELVRSGEMNFLLGFGDAARRELAAILVG